MSLIFERLHPGDASVHNPIIWASLSTKPNNPVTYPNYKYVLDVYINSVLVQRLKAFPQPDTKIGVFDIGPVVRNYVECQLSPGIEFVCQTLVEGQFSLLIDVEAGEEYNGTVYPNIEAGQERYFNTYNEANFSGLAPIVDYRDKVASTRPTLSKVRMGETRFFIPFYSESISALDVTRKLYAKTTRALLNTQTVSTAITNPHMVIINAAPESVNNHFATNIDPALHWGYSLQFGNAGAEYFFELTCEKIHTPYLLHFLNRFGGYETAEFRKRSRINTDITKKSYGQKNYRVNLRSGDPVISYSVNNVLHAPRPTYASTFMDKLKVSSDVLNDDHYVWLRQLVVSPEVYLDKGDGLIYPVSIVNTNYEERKYVNDRVTALTIDLEFGNTLNAQYR